MKLEFTKDTTAEVMDEYGEFYSKLFRKGDIIDFERADDNGKYINLVLANGHTIIDINKKASKNL